MAKEKGKGRRAYLNDFKSDLRGDYIYTGRHYRMCASPEESRRRMSLLQAMALAAALCVLAAGCIPAGGLMNTFYVILVYIGEVATVGSTVWGLVKLRRAGERVREYIYEQTVIKLPGRCKAALVFSLLGFAVNGIYLALNTQDAVPSLCIMALKLICTASVWYLHRSLSNTRWEPEG